MYYRNIIKNSNITYYLYASTELNTKDLEELKRDWLSFVYRNKKIYCNLLREVFYWVKIMTCQGCEQRREWIRKQSERAKERMQLCLQRLTGQAGRDEQSSDATKQQGNRTEQSTHSDQQRTSSTD